MLSKKGFLWLRVITCRLCERSK